MWERDGGDGRVYRVDGPGCSVTLVAGDRGPLRLSSFAAVHRSRLEFHPRRTSGTIPRCLRSGYPQLRSALGLAEFLHHTSAALRATGRELFHSMAEAVRTLAALSFRAPLRKPHQEHRSQ